MKKLLYVLPLILFMQASIASKLPLEKQRKSFLSAEKLIQKGRYSQFFKVAGTLEDYPLYPYLQYQWLKKNLHKTK